MACLVAEENDLALLDYYVRNLCFRRARLLICHTKYDAGDDAKPQCIITKIDILIHTQALTLTLTLTCSPSEQFAPENEHNNDTNDADLYPDRVGDDENVENNLVAEEDEGECRLSTDILDDVEDFDSNDEVFF